MWFNLQLTVSSVAMLLAASAWAVELLDESLICVGSDIRDIFKYRFNGSTDGDDVRLCFFRLADDLLNLINGEDPNEKSKTQLDRLVNMTVARQYCAKYAATLPLMVNPEMHRAIREAALAVKKALQEARIQLVHQPIVPLGIAKIIIEDTNARVTWDDGQETIVPLSTDGKDLKYFLHYGPYQLSWMKDKAELMISSPDVAVTSLHEHGGFWHTINEPWRDELIVMCQQNLSQFLNVDSETTTASTASFRDTASTHVPGANASVRPSSSSAFPETAQITPKSKASKAYLLAWLWLVALVCRVLAQHT